MSAQILGWTGPVGRSRAGFGGTDDDAIDGHSDFPESAMRKQSDGRDDQVESPKLDCPEIDPV
jgi:hypothetical protein